MDQDRRSANPKVSKYFTAGELIDMYLGENNRPSVIDLTGGQPDLAPEWILWTMEALEERGIDDKVFLWSDNNLSNRYFWKFLTREQRDYIASFPKYSRVNCFKGYNPSSFSFNTSAAPEFFNQQFDIFRDLLNEGLDMYAYVTFTALPHDGLHDVMEKFLDRLQEIHTNLPLRTVPLKIEIYTPTRKRIKPDQEKALKFQYEVHAAWLEELNARFSKSDRRIPICDIPMDA